MDTFDIEVYFNIDMRNAVVLVLICLASSSFAQTAGSKKEERKLHNADALFEKAHYEEALELYQELLQSDRDNIILQLKIAASYFLQHDLNKAGTWYKKAFGSSEAGLPPTVEAYHLYNYAEILLSDEQPEEALRWYQLYKQRQPADTRSDRKIEGILGTPELKRDTAYHIVTEASFNSPYADFSPSFYENGLVFVSGRAEAAANQEKNKRAIPAYLDLYYTSFQSDGNFSPAEKLPGSINTDLNEGPSVFYDHDQKAVVTRNSLINKPGEFEEEITIQLQLLYAEKDSSTHAWKEPLLFPISSKDYSSGHPSISNDGRELYFASNMPGGHGGTDLYVCKWENGNWQAPQNLGEAINTEGNEMFPFLYGDTILYFSSNGHAGLGGLDVYSIDLKKNKKVRNLRSPVNSNKDDFGYILNKDGREGYFSSNRKSSGGGDSDDNIFRFTIQVPPPAPPAKQDSVIAEVYYTIQLFALRKKQVINKELLRDLKQVLLYRGKDGLNRYTYGKYQSLQSANEMLTKIIAMGYSDAFIRKETKYVELSKRAAIEVDKLYK